MKPAIILVLFLASLAADSLQWPRSDSVRTRDSLELNRQAAAPTRQMEPRPVAERLMVFGIGTVFVGGLAFLLDVKRRKADRRWRQSLR